MMYLVLCESN